MPLAASTWTFAHASDYVASTNDEMIDPWDTDDADPQENKSAEILVVTIRVIDSVIFTMVVNMVVNLLFCASARKLQKSAS